MKDWSTAVDAYSVAAEEISRGRWAGCPTNSTRCSRRRPRHARRRSEKARVCGGDTQAGTRVLIASRRGTGHSEGRVDVRSAPDPPTPSRPEHTPDPSARIAAREP